MKKIIIAMVAMVLTVGSALALDKVDAQDTTKTGLVGLGTKVNAAIDVLNGTLGATTAKVYFTTNCYLTVIGTNLVAVYGTTVAITNVLDAALTTP